MKPHREPLTMGVVLRPVVSQVPRRRVYDVGLSAASDRRLRSRLRDIEAARREAELRSHHVMVH